MLRLVYHTTVFGPLNLEYPGPRVRVGSCRDNDLVLPHPSVRPYHCTLLLTEDTVTVLPPDAGEARPPDAPCYGPGDRLQIGELLLSIEHSPNTVAVPPPKAEALLPGRNHRGFWRADYKAVPDAARWLCSRCQLRFEDRQIRALGIEGGRKHILCPQCSLELALLAPAERELHGLLGALNSAWGQVRRAFGFSSRRHPPPPE